VPKASLYWLCLLSGKVLAYPYSDPATFQKDGPWKRWGPAFNGLHILTGFQTEVVGGTGFPKRFAYDMCNGLTIQQAWFAAAAACGAGTPAAMGPMCLSSSGWVSDLHDNYWGAGTVGPTIPKKQIKGWWYLQETLPIIYVLPP